MGYSSALSGCYSNAQGTLRSAPFTFRKRVERIDWRKIASLDIEQISRDLDFQALQDNIGNVAFCNIECEIDPRCCDPNYIKLFRLAQLIIEYLLHSQDYLSHTMVALEGKCQELEGRCQELSGEITREKVNRQSLEEDLKASREATKRYKKLYCAQRENANLHSCPFCPKMFETLEYLQMHLERRHLKSPSPAPPQVEANPQGKGWEKLEEEIRNLRRSLELKEKQLQDEQDRRDEMLHKEMEMWKNEQLCIHMKEIEAIRETFIAEVKELCRRATNAEMGIDSLQKQLQCTLSKPAASPPMSQRDDGAEMLKEQKKEFCKLRKHLTELVESVVCQQLKDQEEQLQRKVKGILKEQNQEIGKLNTLVQEKMVQNEVSPNDDLLQSMFEKTKVQEKLLRQQQRQLQKLYCEQKKHVQLQLQQQQQQQQQQQLKELQQQQQQHLQQLQQSLSPSPDSKCKETPKKQRRSDTTADKQSDCKSSRLAEALQKNPSLVQGLRDEISCMLQEKLEMHGIQPVDSSISKEQLREKLIELDHERKLLFQKYPDYKKLRKYYEKRLNLLASEYKSNYEQAKQPILKDSTSSNWKSEPSQDNSESPDQILKNLSALVKKDKLRRRHSISHRAESFQTADESTSSHTKVSPLQGTKLSLQKIISQVKRRFSPKKSWKKPFRTTSSPQISFVEKTASSHNIADDIKLTSSLTSGKRDLVVEYEEEEEVDGEEEEEEEDDDDDEYEYESEEDKTESEIQVDETPKHPKTMYPSLLSSSNLKDQPLVEEPEDMTSHTEWDSASELEEMKDITKTPVKKVESSANLSELVRQKKQGSSNLSAMAQSIENQMAVPRVKPFGGVSVLPDTSKGPNEKVKGKMIPDDLSLSSFSDDDPVVNYNASPVKTFASRTSSNPHGIFADKSSNLQSSSSKPIGAQEKTAKPSLKISSWDSDEDLSEIT